MINCNPIKNGQYQRRDVTVVFDEDDFSKITIKQGDQQICVGDAGFFADVTAVMKRAYKAANKAKYERMNEMFANMLGTTSSCVDDDDDLD